MTGGRKGCPVPTRYEIVVAAGDAGSMVRSALPEFEAQPGRSGCVRLVGTVPDQAALQGALHRLHDLRVELVEVRRLDD
jgi:hypothetical protein